MDGNHYDSSLPLLFPFSCQDPASLPVLWPRRVLAHSKIPSGACIQLWDPSPRKDFDLLGQVRRRGGGGGTKMIKWLKHFSCEVRQRELELLSLDRRKVQEAFIAAFQEWVYLDLNGVYLAGPVVAG